MNLFWNTATVFDPKNVFFLQIWNYSRGSINTQGLKMREEKEILKEIKRFREISSWRYQ